MAAHTPGPWLRDGRSIYAIVHAGWKKGVETFRNWFYVSIQGQASGISDEELEANARLIAAAPELLEMVWYLRNYARLADLGDETIAKMDAVIAKANGGA